MRRKLLAAFVTAAMICMIAAGCTAGSEDTAQPSATATPTPAPKEGIEAVFDKPITITLISNADESGIGIVH